MAVCYFASTLGLKRPRSEGEDSEEEEWEEEWSQRWSGRYGALHAWVVYLHPHNHANCSSDLNT